VVHRSDDAEVGSEDQTRQPTRNFWYCPNKAGYWRNVWTWSYQQGKKYRADKIHDHVTRSEDSACQQVKRPSTRGGFHMLAPFETCTQPRPFNRDRSTLVQKDRDFTYRMMLFTP